MVGMAGTDEGGETFGEAERGIPGRLKVPVDT